MRKRRFLLITLMMLTTGSLFARNYNLYEFGITLWFPDNWLVTEEDDLIEAHSPDSLASFFCSTYYGEEELDQELLEVNDLLDEMFTYYEYNNDVQRSEVNNLNRYELEGTGNSDGTDLNFIIHVVTTPTDNYVLLVGFCVSRYWYKYQDSMYAIVDTLEPLAGY